MPKSANAAAAYIIFLRPVFLYAEIDNANSSREKIPATATITVSTFSKISVWINNPENTNSNIISDPVNISIQYPPGIGKEKSQPADYSIYPRCG